MNYKFNKNCTTVTNVDRGDIIIDSMMNNS